MAANNIFSKTDAPNGETLLKERDTILAYLEELARLKIPVKLWFSEDDRVALGAEVLKVEEGSMRFLLRLKRALPGGIAPKQKVTMVFPLDQCRLLCLVRFLDRGGYLEGWFAIPESLRHAEQRSRLRSKFSTREKATVTVLEGLQDERGATGSLVDLSMTGLCMRVERAVAIRYNHPLTVRGDLFPRGTIFPIIRIEQLPYSPMVECSGRVAHIREDTDLGEVLMGITFDPVGENETQVLNQVMGRRLPNFNQGFPIRERLAQDPDLLVGPAGAGELPEASTSDAPAAGDQEPAAAPAAASVHTPESDEERLARVLRNRKRLKRILLIMFDDLDRAILGSTLKVDGYDKIHEARNFLEAVAHFKVFELDAVIIEQQLGNHSAQDFLQRLRKQELCLDLPVVLLVNELDVRVKIMAKAAKIDRIQLVPVDYDGEFRDALHGLLKLV